MHSGCSDVCLQREVVPGLVRVEEDVSSADMEGGAGQAARGLLSLLLLLVLLLLKKHFLFKS
jgi:hypothetical protein